MATISGELRVCDCCAQMIANDDDTGCQDHYGHSHRPASLVGGAAYVTGEPEEWFGRHAWLCDGCGDWQAYGSHRWDVVVLD